MYLNYFPLHFWNHQKKWSCSIKLFSRPLPTSPTVLWNFSWYFVGCLYTKWRTKSILALNILLTFCFIKGIWALNFFVKFFFYFCFIKMYLSIEILWRFWLKVVFTLCVKSPNGTSTFFLLINFFRIIRQNSYEGKQYLVYFLSPVFIYLWTYILY